MRHEVSDSYTCNLLPLFDALLSFLDELGSSYPQVRKKAQNCLTSSSASIFSCSLIFFCSHSSFSCGWEHESERGHVKTRIAPFSFAVSPLPLSVRARQQTLLPFHRSLAVQNQKHHVEQLLIKKQRLTASSVSYPSASSQSSSSSDSSMVFP